MRPKCSAFLGVAVAICLTLGMPGRGFCQGVQTGTIRGFVTSANGRSLPGVSVRITSAALQGERATDTGEDGSYAFHLVPAGTYTLAFEMSGMVPVGRTLEVPLGSVAQLNVTMQVTGVAETVTVTAEAPPALAAPLVGINIRHDEVEALAVSRTLSGIAELSPGLTNVVSQPGQFQVSINGAFGFDNIFMLNGVDIDDNLFGGPQNLFIEDAIQEVQTLTSGISAEYGRFSGGVVNAITKDGGNIFSGSFRTNFTNPSWSTETPFEIDHGVSHRDVLNKSYEATLGGPIVRDRLWFFAGGRFENVASAQAFPVTGVANTQEDRNRRGEIKGTATVASGHTIRGGYINNHLENKSRPSIPGLSIDPFTISEAAQPNWFGFANYQVAARSNWLAEAQYSQRNWSRTGGGTSSNIVDSPFFSGDFSAHYNAPYFDASDPEHRNNRQLTGNVTSFQQGGAGSHELKVGYEWFRSQWAGGNTQTATGYIFITDYATDAAGDPIYDASGHLIPLFAPGATIVDRSLAQRDSVLNVDNNSAYVQDHWSLGSHWSADLGVRYEHVRSGTTSGIRGVRANTVVPRLAAAYDVQGNGRYVAHATYGHYAGRYDENQIGKNSLQGATNDIVGIYLGPPGEGRSFAPGFDPENYLTVAGVFPTANVALASDLSSPITKEFTTSFGAEVGGRGYVEGTYIFRRTSNLIEDFITLSNGETDVVQDGVEAGTFTNIVYKNSDVARREYQGLLFQGRYDIRRNWSLTGHYTVMLKDEGNYEGEAPNAPGQTSIIGDYPEAFTASRHFPSGRLQNFQRHKLRVWTTYNVELGRYGGLSLSGLWRVNSGQIYSLRALNEPLTKTQLDLISSYPDAPASQTLYFGARGSQEFKGYGLFDTSINYDVNVFRTLSPWIKLDVFNVFDNRKLIRWNTTVTADPTSSTDGLGLATGYMKSAAFGSANSNTNFPAPFYGVSPIASGGRTVRVSAGVRF